MRSTDHLPFEASIFAISEKIYELETMKACDIDMVDEITQLKTKRNNLIAQTYDNLTDADIVSVARHPNRPHSSDYIKAIFTDFEELYGDRQTANCHAIITGIGQLDGKPVAVIGQEKGRETSERLKRNFGMVKPEGYRKAQRIMQMAEKFQMPIVTLIDTPGAHCSIDAEKNNQSQAIAKNLFVMSQLKTPIMSFIIGEGFSGGALAIGVADRVMMLKYAIYACISPEGCASILFKDAAKASQAAQAMCLTAEKVHQHGLIDGIIDEPLGAAHSDPQGTINNVRNVLVDSLAYLQSLPVETLLEQRYRRLMLDHAH